jgi:hypothetical protein
MYAADHQLLFADVARAAESAPERLATVDYDALVALGRRERSRQFARLFDRAVAAVRRLAS